MPYADPKRNAECRAKYLASPKWKLLRRRRYQERRTSGQCVVRTCQSKTEDAKARCEVCQLRLRINKLIRDPEERAKARKALEQFNGFCDCCGEVKSAADCKLDHDHKTGKFRGLLCHNCNTGLGHFFDDTKKMQKAISYLQKSQEAI